MTDELKYTCPLCGAVLPSAKRRSVIGHERAKRHRAALDAFVRREERDLDANKLDCDPLTSETS